VRKRKLVILAASIGLALVLVLSGCAAPVTPGAPGTPTGPATDKMYKALNPRGGPEAEPRIAFTGTLDDAQGFYQNTTTVAKLGNAIIAKWTDGLPIIIPTEEAVKEILTGTSHKASEVMSTYSKDASGKWVKSTTPASFLPSGWQATVEKVAVNAVMAGCKPEYLPAVLAMMSGGPNYENSKWPVGYFQLVSGPYAKEIGFNAGQGAMNPGNPPSMTIGRSFQLCLINLGGCMAGSTDISLGHPLNRTELCYAEDYEALPTGWVGMSEDCGYAKTESVIMLMKTISEMGGQFAPSSFRALNSGEGGIARKLGVEGKPGYYNFVEYMFQWQLMPGETTGGVPVVGAPGVLQPGPLFFSMHPDMALSLVNAGLKTKAEFYQWVYDRSVTPVSDYRKYGWYDENAIEPTSGKAYKDLAADYKVHVFGPAKDMLAIVSHWPGDESVFVFTGGRGIARCIDPWR